MSGRAADTDGFEHANDAEAGDVASENGLLPAGADERLSGEVINFIGLDVTDDLDEGAEVAEVTFD